MKKIILAVLLIFSFITNDFAQDKRFEKIQALKVAFITERLSLSSEQAASFWPVYDNYEKELRGIRRKYIQQYLKSTKAAGNDSDMDAGKLIDNDLDFQQAIIDLKRKYQPEFLKVITARQLDELYTAERIFRQKLIQQLRKRRG